MNGVRGKMKNDDTKLELLVALWKAFIAEFESYRRQGFMYICSISLAHRKISKEYAEELKQLDYNPLDLFAAIKANYQDLPPKETLLTVRESIKHDHTKYKVDKEVKKEQKKKPKTKTTTAKVKK